MLPSTTKPDRSKQKRLLGLFGGKKFNNSTSTVNPVGLLTDLDSEIRSAEERHHLLLADQYSSTTAGTEQDVLESTMSRLGKSVLGTSTHFASQPVENIGSPVTTYNQLSSEKTKRKLHEGAILAWHGFKIFAESAEKILNGTPFSIPVGVLNTLIGILENVIKNNESVSKLLISIHNRFEVIAGDMLQNGQYPKGIELACQNFAKLLIASISSLKEMEDNGRLKQILEKTENPQEVENIFRQVDEATKSFALSLALANIRQSKTIKEHAEIVRLKLGLRPFLDGSYPHVRRDPCAQGTRENILKKAHAWCNDSSPNSSVIFWLSGMGGTGKSTIAYTLCQQLYEAGDTTKVLGASFFCSRQKSDSCRRERIIPTIAHQLAHSFPPYGRCILEAKLDVSPPQLEAHVRELLISPWNQSIQSCESKVPNLIVIIDALDEMKGNDGSKFLQDLIVTISRQKNHKGLKFFVTSRQDPHIMESCKSLESEAVISLQDVASDVVEEDIWKYLQKSLPNLDPSQLRQLAAQASGLFIYAATVVRIIDPDPLRWGSFHAAQNNLESVLKAKTLPKQSQCGNGRLAVDALYEEVLWGYFENISYEQLEMTISVLETVICAQEPLCVSDISEFSNQGKIDMTEEMASMIIRRLHAVLYVDAVSGQVYPYHKSFVDFMCDATRTKGQKLKKLLKKFSIQKGHYHLTIKCFDLMKGLHFNICNLPSSFIDDDQVKDLRFKRNHKISPALQYACRFWAAHLRKLSQKTHENEIKRIFLEWLSNRSIFWIEVMSLLKLVGECNPSLRSARKWLGARILDHLSNVIAAENLVTMFAGHVTVNSTPHLYLSALAILPGNSEFKAKWLSRFPGIPKVNAYLRNEGELILISWPERMSSAAFSPDGSRVVTGSDDNSVSIWDASTGKQVLQLEGHTSLVKSVAFSPDGFRIVSGSWDNSVQIWDASTGRNMLKLNWHTDLVTSVAFSADGSQIVSGSHDNSVQILNVSTGKQVHKLVGHTDHVTSVAFSPGGSQIVSGSRDKSIWIWDVSTGKQFLKIQGHTNWVKSVAFSPDGSQIVSGSDDKSVKIWDALTGRQVAELDGHTGYVTSVSFSPDGSQIISGSEDNTVQIWEVSTRKQVHKFNGHTDHLRSVAFSPDGAQIVSSSDDNTVRIWDASTRKQVLELDGHTSFVTSVAFSPDGSWIVSASNDNSVRIWNASTREKVLELVGHSDWVASVAFSPDGSQVVSGSLDKSVRIWDTLTGKQMLKFDGHGHYVTSVAFSQEGSQIVSGSIDQSVRIWNASTAKQVLELAGHSSFVTSVAFSPNGSRIVSGSEDKSVRIWNVSTGKEMLKLIGHTDYVRSVAFSPDGSHIVSGSDDKSVRIWDALTGKQLRKLVGHAHQVKSVAFSPNGSQIVSGSWDKSLQIWDTSTGKQLSKLVGHTDWVSSVAFSPDGSHIVSGSDDKSVQIWSTRNAEEKLMENDHFERTWSIDTTGWINSPQFEKYMWLPPRLRHFLNSPHHQIISIEGRVDVDFSSACLGQDWSKSYIGNR